MSQLWSESVEVQKEYMDKARYEFQVQGFRSNSMAVIRKKAENLYFWDTKNGKKTS